MRCLSFSSGGFKLHPSCLGAGGWFAPQAGKPVLGRVWPSSSRERAGELAPRPGFTVYPRPCTCHLAVTSQKRGPSSNRWGPSTERAYLPPFPCRMANGKGSGAPRLSPLLRTRCRRTHPLLGREGGLSARREVSGLEGRVPPFSEFLRERGEVGSKTLSGASLALGLGPGPGLAPPPRSFETWGCSVPTRLEAPPRRGGPQRVGKEHSPRAFAPGEEEPAEG